MLTTRSINWGDQYWLDKTDNYTNGGAIPTAHCVGSGGEYSVPSVPTDPSYPHPAVTIANKYGSMHVIRSNFGVGSLRLTNNPNCLPNLSAAFTEILFRFHASIKVQSVHFVARDWDAVAVFPNGQHPRTSVRIVPSQKILEFTGVSQAVVSVQSTDLGPSGPVGVITEVIMLTNQPITDLPEFSWAWLKGTGPIGPGRRH